MLFTPLTQLRGRQKWSALRPHFSLRKITILASLMFWLFIAEGALAQCTMVCNSDSQDSPNTASLNDNCEVILNADAILEAPQGCLGTKTLQVRTESGVLVATGMETVTISGAYVDEIMEITIIDDNTGNSCWSYLLIQDKLAPQIDCADFSVVCSAPIHPDSIGYPPMRDNCDQDLTLNYNDALVNNDCDPAVSAMITRTWFATDDSGNAGTCSQVITMTRPDLDDVVFPDNINLDCASPDANPSITGLPTLNGEVVMNNGFCEFAVDFEDDTTNICGAGSFQILREFTIIDHCMASNNIKTGSQIIYFLDEEAPVIDCPTTMTVGTDANDCSATINVTEPSTTDNCSAVELVVVTSYGQQGFGLHYNVPTGTHTITYRATDACSNISTCSTTLTVVDDEAPSVVCDDRLVISLNSSGVAALRATSINDNSHDNCTNQLDYLAARIDEIDNGFGSRVEFDCNDIGQIVMVVMQVRETNNPALFSECMVEVEVQDKVPPFLTCPSSVVIDCEDDYSDLTVLGEVESFDPCHITVTDSSAFHLNNCGVGTIERIFSAVDNSGNTSQCTQTIFVENNTPFVEDSIQWPLDYVTSDCNPRLEPEDLTVAYSEPIILGETCGLIAASHIDETFVIADQACLKILRKWRLIDWCVFDPAFPERGGLFEHLQVLKVVDNTAPTIQCPNNITAAVNDDCSVGMAVIPEATADDCSTSIQISNNSPFANQDGANATGNYPLGITPIAFTATDGCGNYTSCSMVVTIEDQKAPTPLCITGLSVNLMPMGAGGMVMVEATRFDGGSSDNCTAVEDLIFTIQRADSTTATSTLATASEIMFTCADVGRQDVEIWATDEEGNSAYCETYIMIQDNNGICGTLRPYISGNTRTAEHRDVQDVAICVQATDNSFMDTTFTVGDGSFTVEDIALNQSYKITPMKDINHDNGVTTLDLILMTKHILGVTKLNSPYKIIAADVNRSGHISTSDLIALRKLILRLSDDFRNNTSWRFVDAAYEFDDPSQPLEEAFPEYINLENLSNSSSTNQFVAIKVGDVNQSAIPNNFTDHVENREEGDDFILTIQNEWLEAGEFYELNVTAMDFANILGGQFTLNFDAHALEVIDIQAVEESGLNANNFAWAAIKEGKITATWALSNPIETADEKSNMFQIRLQARKDVQLSRALEVTSDLTKAEAYNSELERLNVNLVFSTPIAEHDLTGFELYQNRPNPFQQETTISFHLPQAEMTYLRVYDVSGKVIYQAPYDLDKGYNEINLDKNDLPTNGVLYYQIKTANYTATRKMFKL